MRHSVLVSQFLKKKRFNTYEADNDEVGSVLDSKVRVNREVPIRPHARRRGGNGNIDVDALGERERQAWSRIGKGQVPDSQARVFNFGKTRHRAAGCWSKKWSSNSGGKGEDKGNGKSPGEASKGWLVWLSQGQGKGKSKDKSVEKVVWHPTSPKELVGGTKERMIRRENGEKELTGGTLPIDHDDMQHLEAQNLKQTSSLWNVMGQRGQKMELFACVPELTTTRLWP